MWVHYSTHEILMRVRTSFFLLLALPCLLSLPFLNAQSSSSPASSPGLSARSLDALLQDYAFRAFIRPRTGIPYDGKVPSNLTGISIAALRLRSGSLRIRGVESYKEFQIPSGVVEQPYVERLVLVYHNLGNWSDRFYPLPGYSYLAPVIGLLAYSAANLSATELPELDIRASDQPILIKFPDVKKKQQPHSASSLSSPSPKCVYFDLNGSVQFDILLPGNVCSTGQQGHFSIVAEESESPSPSPSPSPAPSTSVGVPSEKCHGMKKKKSYIPWIIVGSLVGGLVLLIVLYLLLVKVRRSKETRRIQEMEWAAESNEPLHMASIGGSKAPLALGTRTRPVIENDYVP
ncbi:uncharacterized protein LOC114712423 [Neltuma alba]|uniref:uncharacterized protein LOC114712423 n=1 Tax=Neltuma alba TaxID=207710 RepID=UPI0010A3624C|nr:uncharacterized protein LOC114712423 [Prosopis alba]